MPLDSTPFRTTEALALAITEASSLVTAILEKQKHQRTHSPWFERLHHAYGAIKLAVHEAMTSGRKDELAQHLASLGYQPVGRAALLFGVAERY